MSLLAVIPARLGASRLPQKPLRLLAGEPLIVRVWQRAVAMDVADRCVVATDSEAVAAAVRTAGGEAVLTRTEHPSGTDRVAEVAARPEFRRFDVVVNIQGDEPFASAEVVRAAADLVASGRFPLGTVACPAAPDVLGQSDVVKVVVADDGRALYFSRAAVPHLRDAGAAAERALRDALLRRHVGIYAYTRDALARWVALPPHPLEQVERLEQLRPLAHGIAMGVSLVARAPEPGVDTADDLARANAAWAAAGAARDLAPAAPGAPSARPSFDPSRLTADAAAPGSPS